MDFRFITHEDPAQLSSRHLVCQVRRHKRARTYPYVDVEIVKIQAVQCFIQGTQGSDLINTPQRPSTPQGKAYFRFWLELGRCCHRLSLVGTAPNIYATNLPVDSRVSTLLTSQRFMYQPARPLQPGT